ncbi:MAG: NAD(P)/FAD-dependent oxidoreductase, partial [Gammaproteobacteria bacterium]
MARKLVIIGNGMAPGRLLEAVLEQDREAFTITVFNAEPRVNYDRIQLSPVLAGDKCFDDIVIHDDAWYAAHGITLHKGLPVTAIDRAAREVIAADGGRTAYDELVIATGSRPLVPPLPGRELAGVVTFRDLDDVDAMLAAAARGGRAVVIGGGLLGLEAAAGLAARGMQVTVLHLAASLMERQLDAAAGYLLAEALRGRGIDVVTEAETRALLGEGQVSGVELRDGRRYAADLVVVAIGIRPNVELADAAGLAVARGILVDDGLATSDPAIHALGECVEHRGQCYGLVAPLYEMARVLAARLLGGTASYAGSTLST